MIRALLLAMLMIPLCVGPGFFFIRRLKWSSSEKLCASIGLSIVLAYLVATSIYLLGIGWAWCWLASIIGFGLTALTWRDLLRLFSKVTIHRQIWGFGFLLLIGTLMLALIRHYAGGEWSGDWFEHYQRVMFFLHRWPRDILLIEQYSLSARPPLMNLTAAYFLAQVNDKFDMYQLCFQFLNLLIFFPCVLIADLLIKNASRKIWLLVTFLSLNPMVWENATWAWTKLLAGFFILLSLALYLRGWRKNDPTRMIAAAASMAAGLLVHYSAAPYAIALFVHYLFILAYRRHKVLETLVGGGIAILLLATWFTWSLAFYGRQTTFGSNTTATDMSKHSLVDNVVKVARNAFATLAPHPITVPHKEFALRLSQPNPFGFVRDFFFLIYQTNLTMAWGLLAWLPLWWLVYSQLAQARPSLRWFWIIFLTITISLGIGAVGSLESFGVAHACLQPVVLLGLVLLAGGFSSLPRWVRCILVASLVIDLLLGVVLHVRLEMQVFRVLPGPIEGVVPLNDGLLSVGAVRNSVVRFRAFMTYWGDHFESINLLIRVLLTGIFAFIVFRLATAAMQSPREPLAKARVWGTTMAILFIIGTIVCNLNGVLGYDGTRLVRDPAPASVEPLLRAVEASPDSEKAYYDLGLAYHNMGDIAKAADAWMHAFMLNPFNLQTRYQYGLMLSTHGLTPGSGPAKIPEIFLEYPDRVEAQIDLIRLLIHHNHVLPALKRLRQTAIEHPSSPEVQELMKSVNADLPSLDRAIREMEGARQ